MIQSKPSRSTFSFQIRTAILIKVTNQFLSKHHVVNFFLKLRFWLETVIYIYSLFGNKNSTVIQLLCFNLNQDVHVCSI